MTLPRSHHLVDYLEEFQAHLAIRRTMAIALFDHLKARKEYYELMGNTLEVALPSWIVRFRPVRKDGVVDNAPESGFEKAAGDERY